MSKHIYAFWLLAIVILGVALRFHGLGGRSLWTDEAFTLFLATGHGKDVQDRIEKNAQPGQVSIVKAKEYKRFLHNDPLRDIRDVTAGVIETDTHPPLYFWVMHFWMRLIGDDLFSVRSFSLIVGIISIIVVYRIVLRLFDRDAAIFSSFALAVSSYAVRFSQEARSYSMVLLLGFLSWLFLLRVEKDVKLIDAAFFVLINGLGLYAHYFYIFIAFAQFIYFTITHRNNSRTLDAFYLTFIISWLLLLPWAIMVFVEGYRFDLVGWLFGYPGIMDKVQNLFMGLGNYFFTALPHAYSGSIWFMYLGVSLLMVLMLFFTARMIREFRRSAWFCLIMFLVPLTIMFILDIFQHGAILKQERFWMFAYIGFIPWLGYVLSRVFLKNRVTAYTILAALVIPSMRSADVHFGAAPKASAEYIETWVGNKGDVTLGMPRSIRGSVLAVIVYNCRSVILPQAYYLSDDTYVAAVSDSIQLEAAGKMLAGMVDRVFLCRHYHPTDPVLMDQLFLDAKHISSHFCRKKFVLFDKVSVAEYVTCDF